MYTKDTLDLWYSGQGVWEHVPKTNWDDWKWQLKNRLTQKAQISKYLKLSEEESLGLDIAGDKLLVSITPHFFNLIDPDDPNCPIRKQVIPTKEEGVVLSYENEDPVGEEQSMAIPGLVHRYPDRVLFLVTDRCGSYCRYCTRSRLVSNAQGYGFRPNIDQCLNYIRKHTEIRDVLISGGDPYFYLIVSSLSCLMNSLRYLMLNLLGLVPVYLSFFHNVSPQDYWVPLRHTLIYG